MYVKGNVGYLTTIKAPATSKVTINEVLHQSLRILHSLELTCITHIFDPAIYCKAREIKLKKSDLYELITFSYARSTHYVPSSQSSERGFKMLDSGICESSQESWLRGI